MLIYHHHNIEQNYDIKRTNKPFENVAKFRYLDTKITNQYNIHGEIMSRLYLRTEETEFLLSHVLSKSLKIKIHKPIILPTLVKLVLSLGGKNTDRLFVNSVLWKICGPNVKKQMNTENYIMSNFRI
jgi:hypothetical protein